MDEGKSFISINQIKDKIRILPKSSLDQEDINRELRETFTTFSKQDEINFIFDMSCTKTLNSTSIELIVDFNKLVLGKKGNFRIINCSMLIMEQFIITYNYHKLNFLDDYTHVLDIVFGARFYKKQPGIKIGDVLIQQNLINKEQLEKVLEIQKDKNSLLGEIIVKLGFLDEEQILKAIAKQLNLTFMRLTGWHFDHNVSNLIEDKVAQRLFCVPLFKVHNTIYLATNTPQSAPQFNEIEQLTNCIVMPVITTSKSINNLLSEAYNEHEVTNEIMFDDIQEDLELINIEQPDEYSEIDNMASESPVINMVNMLIQKAIADSATDIHIEPFREKTNIRFRMNGILHLIMSPSVRLHPALVSRLKIMANLDITERRMPQDGRIQVFTKKHNVDLRFSSMPGIYGEKVVLRILDKSNVILDVDSLGMPEDSLKLYKKSLQNSNGMILVTGPTGSGKTTTLYATLSKLNSLETSIVTIEDPVEYQMPIMNQNEINEAIGLDFSTLLKTVLRQDPDIVMVGEIRNEITAKVAVQASLTGHLVLSTLHTNDCAGTITRLLEMDIEPYLLSSIITCIVAQRLVRKVCDNCKKLYLPQEEVLNKYKLDLNANIKFAKGKGCDECYDTGYKGRIVIYELLTSTPELQEIINSRPSRSEIAEYMEKHNLRTLMDSGLEKVVARLSTLEEISRAVNL